MTDAIKTRLLAAPASTAVGTLDLGSVLSLVRRRWLLILTIAGLIAALVTGASLMITPVFTANAQIKIDPNERTALDLQAASRGGSPDQAVVDTEVALMRSRSSAQAVVAAFHLTSDPEFASKRGGADLEQGVVDDVLHNLTAARVGTTYVVNIAFRSMVPSKAARIADAFADQYIRSSVNTKTSAAAQQSVVLDKRLADLGAEVRAADAQVAQYRARAGIVQGGANGTITDQQVGPLSIQLATAESEAAAARATLDAARSQTARGGQDAVSGVLSSAVIADLRRQRAEVLREKAQVDSRYGPLHPETLRVTQQLVGLDRQISDESQRIVSGLDSTSKAAAARAGSLRGDLARLRSQQAGNTVAAVTAESLERQAEAKRTVYNQLAQAAQQISQQEHGTESLGHIIQRADVPITPTFPKRSMFALLGLILGLIAGVAVAVLLDVLATGVRTVNDVENGLGATFIASVPRLSSGQLRIKGKRAAPWDFVLAKPMSAFSESLRTTRTALQMTETETPPKVIAITSALPGDGKTSFSAALARIMALSGDKVVLIDGDLRRNGLASLVGKSPAAGLVELLTGERTLAEVLVTDVAPNLHILPLVQPSFLPQDLFGREAMRNLLNELKRTYDYVVIDTPPLLAVADARTLTSLADAVVLLVKWNDTNKHAVRAALTRLDQDNTVLTGIVLTMASTKAGTVDANDPAYYQSNYSAYYQN